MIAEDRLLVARDARLYRRADISRGKTVTACHHTQYMTST